LPYHQPFQVSGFHSCDKEVGIRVLNGEDDLKPSDNKWDWLAHGVYFWEQNPARALEFAIENAAGQQFNKVKIRIPFVLGATVELGNCLNLVERQSLSIVQAAYIGLERLYKETDRSMPVNKGNNRALDCAVIKFVHQTRINEKKSPYNSIRCAFSEGEELYKGSNFSSRLLRFAY